MAHTWAQRIETSILTSSSTSIQWHAQTHIHRLNGRRKRRWWWLNGLQKIRVANFMGQVCERVNLVCVSGILWGCGGEEEGRGFLSSFYTYTQITQKLIPGPGRHTPTHTLKLYACVFVTLWRQGGRRHHFFSRLSPSIPRDFVGR